MTDQTHVELRPARADDLADLYVFESDPVSAAMAGVKARDEAAFRARWERLLTSGSVIQQAILADGELAGSIGCFEMDGQWELGYWIGRPYWNRGIATRALGLLLGLVETRPLRAQVLADNRASIRVLERHGFKRIGEADEPETDRFIAAKVLTYRLT